MTRGTDYRLTVVAVRLGHMLAMVEGEADLVLEALLRTSPTDRRTR